MSEVTHIEVEGDVIPVTPSEEHEWTLTTDLVAQGYGVSASVIRDHKNNHTDELSKGKHFSSVENIDAGNLKRLTTIWTKRGVVRLGFFIRSERAKIFRDRAEDLIIAHEDSSSDPILAMLESAKATHLRQLEQERKQKEHDLRLHQLECHVNRDEEHVTVIGYCNLRNLPGVGRDEAKKIGQKLKNTANDIGVEVTKIPDAKWGRINTYPIEFMDKYFQSAYNAVVDFAGI